jgi:hypothetical protein
MSASSTLFLLTSSITMVLISLRDYQTVFIITMKIELGLTPYDILD